MTEQRHDPITLDIIAASKAGFYERRPPLKVRTLTEFYELYDRVRMMTDEGRKAHLAALGDGELMGRRSLSGRTPVEKSKRRRSLRG